MAIIKHTKNGNLLYEYLAIFPDQYVSDAAKRGDDFIKMNMDYFSTVAYAQFARNRRRIVPNYNLIKGRLTRADFYEAPETKNFIENLETEELALPDHVKNYTIMNPPINTLLGELSKRPDTTRVKAFDSESQSEELQFRTDLLQQMILQKAQTRLFEKLSQQGVDVSELDPEQIQEMTTQQVEEYLTAYTSLAEQWANKVLEALKVQLNLKEKSEDAFRDLLISGREYLHVFETNSNTIGLDVECVNPKNLWYLTTPDKKYSNSWYAGGIVEVMEISQIIDRFPEVTKEEIDHLRKNSERFNLMDLRESNYGNGAEAGINSIKYDVYDQAIFQERMLIESQMHDNPEELNNFLGLSSNISNFGNKFSVVTAYWSSKKKIGNVKYWDEEAGEVLSTLVDETYVKGSMPNEISVEWRYSNQWYRGIRIGPDVYHVAPYKLLPYCPIIGVVHEIKNTHPSSLVDMMKPFQMIYNVCINQLWKLLEKEKGKVFLIPLRHIPIPKDGDAQDALDLWETEAEERGILFIDDSPENAKSLSSFNQYREIDLSRSQEMQARYNLAVQMKLECWELVGLTRERLGTVAATQTATGVNTSLSQSYAQTEPYFTQHEYVMNELYQALLDAAQYIESHKPMSTLSYITSDGENSFIQINGSELKLRDLKVFVTSRQKDQNAFQQLQQLSQAALQNGASLYDIAELYTTDSMRKLKDTFKRLRDRQDEYMKQQQEMQQQQLDQNQQQFLQAQEAQELQHREEMVNENYQKELDRINKKEIALIQTFNRQDDNLKDTDASGTPDVLEISRLNMEEGAAQSNFNVQLQKLANERAKIAQDRTSQIEDIKMKKEELRVKEMDIRSKERIAKANKNKYDKK